MSPKTQAVWHKAVAESTAALVDNSPESDGLRLTRELRDKYAAKADWLLRLNKYATAAYYIAAVCALSKFIGFSPKVSE